MRSGIKMTEYKRTNEVLPEFLKETACEIRVHWDSGAKIFKALAYDEANARGGFASSDDIFIAIRSAITMFKERPYPMDVQVHRGT
jgi:hypothetical protein